LRARRVYEDEKGIQFPNPDFAAFAQACGGRGFKVDKPDKLRSTITEALACDGPAIVDAVVVADEMPNVPRVELAEIRLLDLAAYGAEH
jgi:pyruvate dehydrogenase (quinone)